VFLFSLLFFVVVVFSCLAEEAMCSKVATQSGFNFTPIDGTSSSSSSLSPSPSSSSSAPASDFDLIPIEWIQRSDAALMLLNWGPEPEDAIMPPIGNGYIGTVVGNNSVFVAGVFNGYGTVTPSHRARIPATLAISIVNSTIVASALDIERAIYYRRSLVNSTLVSSSSSSSPSSTTVATLLIEQRWYVHQSLRSIMVHEMELVALINSNYSDNNTNSGYQRQDLGQEDFFSSFSCSISLSINHGPNSTDIDFQQQQQQQQQQGLDYDTELWIGKTLMSETNSSGIVAIGLVTSTIPSTFVFNITINNTDTTTTTTFLTAIRTSLDSADPLTDALTDYSEASSLSHIDYDNHANVSMLQQLHIEAWQSLWQSGGSIATDDLSLARLLNSSLYYLLSSVRTDWPWSLATGGLSRGSDQRCYNGHTFSDAETWMSPGLIVLYPDIAASVLQYRLNRQSGARIKAQSYRPPYEGTMFPWESAFTGTETCPEFAPTGTYEQHISGDVGCATKRFWQLTHNITWLETQGYPLIQGIAEVVSVRKSY